MYVCARVCACVWSRREESSGQQRAHTHTHEIPSSLRLFENWRQNDLLFDTYVIYLTMTSYIVPLLPLAPVHGVKTALPLSRSLTLCCTLTLVHTHSGPHSLWCTHAHTQQKHARTHTHAPTRTHTHTHWLPRLALAFSVFLDFLVAYFFDDTAIYFQLRFKLATDGQNAGLVGRHSLKKMARLELPLSDDDWPYVDCIPCDQVLDPNSEASVSLSGATCASCFCGAGWCLRTHASG